jgi:hypothetical protein
MYYIIGQTKVIVIFLYVCERLKRGARNMRKRRNIRKGEGEDERGTKERKMENHARRGWWIDMRGRGE